MAADNDEQIALWNEETGRRWTEQQERLDRLIAPFGDEAMRVAAVKEGERLLDVGCGCGDTTLSLARAVGADGFVLGVDVSAPMLARAQERAVGVSNVRFERADASVAPLGGPHDLIYSRFGVMFFSDPAAAFAHLRGALKPGGRMAFACWRAFAENPWVSVATLAAMRVLGPPKVAPDPHAPGPFAFADADRVRAILDVAGFSRIAIAPYDAVMKVGDDLDDAMTTTLQVGPVSALMRGVEDDQRAAVTAAVRDALSACVGPGGVMMTGATWIVSASL
jgi:SAM-dependent methyltransferase